MSPTISGAVPPTLPQPWDIEEAADVLDEACFTYRNAGLRMPPVPRQFLPRLQEVAVGRFGTDEADLSDREGFLAQARRPDALHAVGFGHVAHGPTSWWLCYRLVIDPFAAFVRQSFGGAYDDPELSRELANVTAETIEELVMTAYIARRLGRIAPGQRLILVVDDRDGGGWEVTGGLQKWRASEMPLADVMEYLDGGEPA
jgi:hypothetical protein